MLTATLDALDLPSVDVVANSIGGAMALWLAREHPARVRGLGLVGATAMIGEVPEPIVFRLLGTPGIQSLLLGMEPPSPKQVRTMLARFGHPPAGVHPSLLEVLLRVEQMPAYARAWRDVLSSSTSLAGAKPGLRIANAELATVRSPIAFAWGDADPTVSWRVGQAVAERIGARFAVVPGAGHLPWLDDARAVARAIEPVLAPAG